ncbi:uncharacterized protein LOC120806969 [Xyrichtys novacula]|uniref:Uncharacterized protein LOC120806969 n=1 Tax=Xyrichtys novacula TaxID=13765 RepID=A0AAV1EQC8_XYRNO|nr:uncharacterized protein LOC120806969 [Xyrichtys novacula]
MDLTVSWSWYLSIMEDINMDCCSSEKCGNQDMQTHVDLELQELSDKILQLLDNKLQHHLIMDKLEIMQRSSSYLDIQREDLPPSEEQQHTSPMTNSTLWSLIDQQRLSRVKALTHTQVKLILTMLEFLAQQIFSNCRELMDFTMRHSQGLSNSNETASIQEKLEQTLQHMSDFDRRVVDHLGPLILPHKLIPNEGHVCIPKLRAYFIVKLPIHINRSESRATSTSMHLYWTEYKPQDPLV